MAESGRADELRRNCPHRDASGTMPGGTTMEQVYDLVAEQAPEVDGVEVHEISVEQDSTYLAVFCLRKTRKSGGSAAKRRICQTGSDLRRRSGTGCGSDEEEIQRIMRRSSRSGVMWQDWRLSGRICSFWQIITVSVLRNMPCSENFRSRTAPL